MTREDRGKRRRGKLAAERGGYPDRVARWEQRIPPRRLRLWVLCLLAAMAGVRLLYYLELGRHVLPSADSSYFLSLGKRIAAGDVFLEGQSLPFSPLYYYFLGGVFALCGPVPQWALAIQFVMGIAGAYLLFLLARELWGPLAGLLALGLYLLYGLFVAYEGQVLDASFSVVLPAAFLLLLHRAARGGRWSCWFAAGVTLGLFALTRPNILVFFPVAGGWALWAGRDQRSLRRRLAALGCVAGGIACCVLPFTVRNVIVTGEPVLVTAHGGINFYVGNNRQATGFYTPPAGMPPLPGEFNLEVPRQVAQAETGKAGMSDAEVSSYWFHRGLDFIRQEPGRFVQLTLRKTRAFFNGYEVPLNVDFYLLRSISTALKIACLPLGVLMPLGLVGMGLALGRWRSHALLLSYFCAYSASVILFFIADRYRLPVAPVLVLYGAFGLRAGLEHLGRPARAGAMALAFVLLVFLVNTKLPLQFNPAIVAHNRAYTLESMGRISDAVAYYLQALRLDPRQYGAHFNLARIYAAGGDLDRARSHCEAAVRFAPEGSAARADAERLLADL